MLKHRSFFRAIFATITCALAFIGLAASTATTSIFKTIDFAPEATAQLERSAIESATVEPGFTVSASAPMANSNSAREHSNLVKSLDRTPGIICPRGSCPNPPKPDELS